MGYNRLWVFGRNAELYQYEKNISNFDRRGRKIYSEVSSRNDVLSSVACDSENTPDASTQTGRTKDNARRARVAFKRLVLSNLDGHEKPILISLTYKENMADIVAGYRDFTSFIKALRYRFGSSFRYVAVPEFQQRGAVHFHSIFWGLPPELVGQERSLRTIASIWQRGFVDLIETDGHDKLAGYLSKYMAKAFVDIQLKNQKAYVSSRNCARPFTVGGVDSMFVFLDDVCGVDASPYDTRIYDTSYLGTCKLSLFDVLPENKSYPFSSL